MASHFDDFGVSAGNLLGGEQRADLPARRRVDHAERDLLVVGHQEQPAVADRLDGRGLEHAVHALRRVARSRRLEERRGDRDRRDGDLVAGRHGSGRRERPGRDDQRGGETAHGETWGISSLEVDRVFVLPLGHLDLGLRGAGVLVLERDGVLLAGPGDRHAMGAGDGAVVGLEGGQLEGPVRLDVAVGLPAARVGLEGDLALGQGLALVQGLPLDRDGRSGRTGRNPSRIPSRRRGRARPGRASLRGCALTSPLCKIEARPP